MPLEFASAEDRYQREPVHDETPERIFERRWALSVPDPVVERLRGEFMQHDRPVANRVNIRAAKLFPGRERDRCSLDLFD